MRGMKSLMTAVRHGMGALLMVAVLATTSGCALFGNKESTFRLHEEVNAQLEISKSRTVRLPETGRVVAVSPYATLSERDIEAVRVIQQNDHLGLLVKLDPHGTAMLDEMTTRMRGLTIVVFVDDQPVTAWVVQHRISNGQLPIKPFMTDAQIMELAESLRRTARKANSLYLRE